METPSQHQINDYVWLNLGVSLTAQVLGIRFIESKVSYDLIVIVGDKHARIYNVNSDFVVKM